MENNPAAAYRLGFWSSILLLGYSLATVAIVTLIGGPPESVSECFGMLSEDRVKGLLRLDVLTVFVMPLYYVLFYSLYLSLRDINPVYALLSFVFVVTGVTLFLAAPSVFSYVQLSDSYRMATTEGERQMYRSAAAGILATDIWNGTGPRIGGLLVQSGATVLSCLMFRSPSFPKLTAYTGVFTHGLDLAHIITGFFLPVIANGLMAVAGTLYLLWFPMIAISLFNLQRKNSTSKRSI
jgi:hypothetical protein